MLFTRVFNPLISLLKNRVNVINKMFSDLYYDISLSEEVIGFSNIDYITSIRLTTKQSDIS